MRLNRVITIGVFSGLSALIFGAPAVLGPAASVDRLVAAVPFVLDYQFFDHYYTETLAGDAKYSEIEAYVKENGGKPRTTVKLIEKGGNAETYNQIQYVAPKAYMPGGTAGFAFLDQAGQPVRWRFVIAYPPSAQGSGLSELPNETNLKLVYRNLGTLSDSGSAVELSGKVNQVQVWKEISQPPYFVAYRATYTAGAHMTELHAKLETLNFAGFSALKAGAQFTVSAADGASRQLAVQSQGDALLVAQKADDNGVSRQLAFVADGQGGGSIRYLAVGDGAHSATVTFTPPLRLSASAGEGSPSEFQISVDKKNKLANGTVRFTYAADGAHLTWKVASPSWAKGRTLVQNLTASDHGVTIAMAR